MQMNIIMIGAVVVNCQLYQKDENKEKEAGNGPFTMKMIKAYFLFAFPFKKGLYSSRHFLERVFDEPMTLESWEHFRLFWHARFRESTYS